MIHTIYVQCYQFPLSNANLIVSVPMVDVKGVLGKSEGLPCDIKPKDRDDGVAMVLWFKESFNGPIYR